MHTINNPNLDSALRHVPYDESLPIPTPPVNWTLSDNQYVNKEQADSDRNNDSDFAPSLSSTPHRTNQENNMIW